MTENIGKHLFLALIVIVLLIGIYISINSASFRLNSTEHFGEPDPKYPAPVNFRILNISEVVFINYRTIN